MATRPELQPGGARPFRQSEEIIPPSPRSVSFATSPTRPPLLSDTEHVPDSFVWTEALERRLVLVQSELKKSQRRWSESQDIWLEEEHNLLELKKRFKKAQKADATAKKAALAWKNKTFSKPKLGSRRSSRKNSAVFGEDNDESDVEGGGRPLERANTGGSITSAIRRLSVSVMSRNNSSPGTPMVGSRSGSHHRGESRGSS